MQYRRVESPLLRNSITSMRKQGLRSSTRSSEINDIAFTGQFEKYGQGMIDMLGAEYDFDSIMHYGPRAFSRNGKPTMVPKRPANIGQRLRFSKLDLYKLNKLYDCSSMLF